MIKNPKEYWANRYARQGYQTTGFCGHNIEQMEESYNQRFKWLNTFLPEDRAGVLDYGCGTGRYCNLFDKVSYIGFDIESLALTMAREMNPYYSFTDKPIKKPKTLFTSTVLQHNTDEEVSRIIEQYKDCNLWLYEFTGSSSAAHMASRTVEDYEVLARRKCRSYTHNTHGANHSLMIFK